jgi:hypothetical protein
MTRQSLRHEFRMLALEATYWWRVARRAARRRWCHLAQHWRNWQPVKCQGPGFRCPRCRTWWPDLVAMGAVTPSYVPLSVVRTELQRQQAGPINAELARRVR